MSVTFNRTLDHPSFIPNTERYFSWWARIQLRQVLKVAIGEHLWLSAVSGHSIILFHSETEDSSVGRFWAELADSKLITPRGADLPERKVMRGLQSTGVLHWDGRTGLVSVGLWYGLFLALSVCLSVCQSVFCVFLCFVFFVC